MARYTVTAAPDGTVDLRVQWTGAGGQHVDRLITAINRSDLKSTVEREVGNIVAARAMAKAAARAAQAGTKVPATLTEGGG